MTDAEISAAWDAQASSLEDARRATGAHDSEMTAACLGMIQNWIPPSLEPLRLLEIGCGIGRLTFPMAKACPRAVILGIDASPKMLAHFREARDRLFSGVGAAPEGGVRCVQSCRPGPYGFGRDLYDGAWSVLTLQHMAPALAREYVVSVGQALRPDGRFVFQFIEGDERQPLSNHFRFEDVTSWCNEGRMGVAYGGVEGRVFRGVGHDLWTWIVAEKM